RSSDLVNRWRPSPPDSGVSFRSPSFSVCETVRLWCPASVCLLPNCMSIIPVILKIPKEFFRGSRQISAVNSVGGTVCQKRPLRSDFDTQYKEKANFSLPLSPLCVLPLFGRVRGCVASFGEGQSPCAPPGGYRPDLGRCPAVWEECLFGAPLC